MLYSRWGLTCLGRGCQPEKCPSPSVWKFKCNHMNWADPDCGICHACSRSPSLALEGAKLPVFTRTWHHHYVCWIHLDSFTWLIAPVYICLFLGGVLCVRVKCLCSCPDAAPVPFHVRRLLNLHSLYLLLISCVDPFQDLSGKEDRSPVWRRGYFEQRLACKVRRAVCCSLVMWCQLGL